MRRPYSIMTSFLDVLFNILLGIFVLLILVALLVNPAGKKGEVELKAEFLITMEWGKDSNDDIDLFVLSPTGKVTYYGQPNTELVSLDRDDRGQGINDSVILQDGTSLKIEDNWEHVTIRKSIPGEFIVNVLMYNHRDDRPTEVNVKVERLNPYSVIFAKRITLSLPKEEVTAVRFTLDSNGKVSQLSTMQEPLLNRLERR